MARAFKPVDRDQVMLLPMDLREWLPLDHLAWLVIEVVAGLDLSAVERCYTRGGRGRQAYDPQMLTALLVYAYCQGVRSSRAIERACVTDVAFRVITAQQRPDHTTVARFRADHAEALAGLFGQVLMVCARAGMVRVGSVAVDGFKVAANASPGNSHTAGTLRRLAEKTLAEAEQVDAAEDAAVGAAQCGDELPETLQPGTDRASRIKEALRLAEEEEQARHAADVKVAERAVARAEQRLGKAQHQAASRRVTPAEPPKPVREAQQRVAEAETQLAQAHAGEGAQGRRTAPRRNTTDPDSRIMTGRGGGYLQGFNAQAVVSDDHVIIATDVTNQAADRALFTPMMQLAAANAAMFLLGATIVTVLADAGYCSEEALTSEGPDRLIATGRDPAKSGRGPAVKAMAARLAAGSEDRTRYRRRAATVEPVIGHLKDRIGLRRFSRRGLDAARHELAFAATAHNIRRLAAQRRTQTG